MARRKLKKPQQEDTSILLESSVPQSRKRIKSSYVSPALLFLIVFTVGASIMGWFCMQQQQSLDQLSESFTTMQKQLTNLQQVMEMTDVQTDTGFDVEERIFALEEAQKQAQEKAKVALATSENLKNTDLYSDLWALNEEMESHWAEIQQVSLSITTLQAMFKNQSEEFEAVKERVATTLSSSSALAENVAGLTSVVASARSRVDKQVASVEALNAQLGGQSSELNELRELLYLHNVALYTNNQEMTAIKELLETKQAMRAQALEEMLSSVQVTLDEHFFTSQNLHSSVMAQLQTFHTQLANGPSRPMKLKSDEEDPVVAAAVFISTSAQDAREVQEKIEDVEEEAEQQGTQDGAEEEAKEEAIQEAQPLEQEMEQGVMEEQEITPEEQEEEITPEEEEEEEITRQSEKQEDAGKTGEEEVSEETTEGHILDESLEEELYEEVVESWDSAEEDEEGE
ncbi:neurofilament light polypeptide [Lates calcarifer]|uniref:Neurofilament light polypeptide n=1 Tax=Lates calcarifer TaxID=8187 RepID=A0A4W6CID5_LATCA|nr:neurofilament light polypeptide [Lates calcarifer]